MTDPRRRFRLTVDVLDTGAVGALPKCWIDVAVYETTDQMHQAMIQYGLPAKLARESGGGFGHPAHLPRTGHLGILRLALDVDDLSSIIIHEAVHVAVRAAKRHFGVEELRLNEAKNAEREEVVAYYAGVFADALQTELL